MIPGRVLGTNLETISLLPNWKSGFASSIFSLARLWPRRAPAIGRGLLPAFIEWWTCNEDLQPSIIQ